jgi:hypothetical protein
MAVMGGNSVTGVGRVEPAATAAAVVASADPKLSVTNVSWRAIY